MNDLRTLIRINSWGFLNLNVHQECIRIPPENDIVKKRQIDLNEKESIDFFRDDHSAIASTTPLFGHG